MQLIPIQYATDTIVDIGLQWVGGTCLGTITLKLLPDTGDKRGRASLLRLS